MSVSGAFSPQFMALLAAMGSGYLVRSFGMLSPAESRKIMVKMQKYVTPWVFLLSFWGLNFGNLSLLALPFAGLSVICIQFAMSLFALKFLRLEAERKGAFLVAAILSNIGYLGWFFNLSLFGHKGYEYAFLYGFYFTPATYALAYPVAARYSRSAELKQMDFGRRLFLEGILAAALTAMAAGIVLNCSGIRRPEVLGTLNTYLVFGATAIMMFAAGLTINIRSLKPNAVPSLVMCLIKLVLTPILMWLLLPVLTGHSVQTSLAARVVVIESMMPLAISCLTISNIFHLDQDLTNTMWLFSTLLFFAFSQIAVACMGLG